MVTAVVILLVLVVVALSVWGARHVQHPENTAGHAEDPRRSVSERFYSDTDRPAGPDAEEPVGGLHGRPDARSDG